MNYFGQRMRFVNYRHPGETGHNSCVEDALGKEVLCKAVYFPTLQPCRQDTSAEINQPVFNLDRLST